MAIEGSEKKTTGKWGIWSIEKMEGEEGDIFLRLT